MAKKQNARAAKNELPDDLLGPVEFMVIRAVMELGADEAYGMAVCEAIQSVCPRISFGSVYTALDRLRWRGYLESELGEPESTRGGRARNYYRVTDLGERIREAMLNMYTAPLSRNNEPLIPAPGKLGGRS